MKPRCTALVAYTVSGWDSRSDSRPRQCSRSPLVRMMPAIGECRGSRGCKPGKLSICERISGEALSSTQRSSSTLTATHSCVRGTRSGLPERALRQFGQPQFHCGNPPPAAAPSTLTCIGLDTAVAVSVEIVLVGVDLGVHLHFNELRCLPRHMVAFRRGVDLGVHLQERSGGQRN